MTLRLTKKILCAFAVLAFTTTANFASAADGSYIVASQVVSDTAAPASSFVGDLASTRLGSSISSCQSCESGSCGTCSSGTCGAGCQAKKYGQPDLFYNYYSQGNCNSANAQMYVSPMPVPHFVGHTFNTYQPLYPHEFMYKHTNRYHNNYDNGRGMNRTKVHYSYPPVKQAISNLYWNKLRLPR